MAARPQTAPGWGSWGQGRRRPAAPGLLTLRGRAAALRRGGARPVGGDQGPALAELPGQGRAPPSGQGFGAGA
eukprot:6544960-Pyramimonas_sp.AAC.1